MVGYTKAVSPGREDLLPVLNTLEQIASMVSDALEQLRRSLPPPTEVIPLPAPTRSKGGSSLTETLDLFLQELGGSREEIMRELYGFHLRNEEHDDHPTHAGRDHDLQKITAHSLGISQQAVSAGHKRALKWLREDHRRKYWQRYVNEPPADAHPAALQILTVLSNRSAVPGRRDRRRRGRSALE
jgi:hypothetical protein